MRGAALLALAPLGALCWAPNVAHAQAQPEVGATQQLDSIVVTARKRDESLLQVPVAVSAISASALTTENITSLQDVANFTPSLQLNEAGSLHSDRSNQQLVIRGMYDPTSPTVSVFIDGAPVGSGFVSNVQDASRIEILKGPQSAYFGRETFAGAINIVTKDPPSTFDGSASILAGTNNWYDGSIMVEGPIAPNLSGRLDFRGFTKGGQYTDSIEHNEVLGSQSTESFSGALKYTPIPGLVAKFYGTYWEDHDGPAAQFKYTTPNFNCNAGGAPAGTFNTICGTLPVLNSTNLPQVTSLDSLFRSEVFGNSTGTLNPLFKDLSQNPGLTRKAGHAHIDLEYTPPSLNITFSSLTAVNAEVHEDIVNLDNEDTLGIPNTFNAFIPGTETYELWMTRVQSMTHDVSQEFRVSSDQSQRFRWLLGVNYDAALSQGYVDGLFPYGAGTFGAGGPQYTNTAAVFFSFGYDILSNLKLNFEGRYQDDKISVYSRPIGAPETVIASSTNNSFLPRASLQYDFSKSANIYASYSEGVNPPIFNTGLIGLDPQIIKGFQDIYGAGIAVQPEYVKDYEVGAKGSFFGNKLQIAADAYYMQWTNQILSVFGIIPAIPGVNFGLPYSTFVEVNAGRTHLDGVEFDGSFAPVPEFVINFAGTYGKSALDSYPGYICPGYVCNAAGNPTNVNGHALPFSPEFSGNIGATYTGRLSSDLSYYIRGEDLYIGSRYTDLMNITSIGASNKVNLRLGLNWRQTKVEFFAENLLNDRQFAGVDGGTDIDGTPTAGGVYPAAFNLQMPVLRQFSVRLTEKF